MANVSGGGGYSTDKYIQKTVLDARGQSHTVTVPNPNYVPPSKSPSSKPSGTSTSGGTHTQVVYLNGAPYIATIDANGNTVNLSPVQSPNQSQPQFNPNTGAGVGGGASGAMTAYEQQQIALDKQRLADAEAQQKADQTYRDAQAVDTWTKNWQDFQTKNHYGSMAGPAFAAPAGSPFWFKMPEPTYIADWYKNNPNAGPDPWNLPSQMSGYSGSSFANPQQPGVQNAGLPGGPGTNPQIGNTPAPIQGSGYAAGKAPVPTPTPLPSVSSSAGTGASGATPVPSTAGMATPAQIKPTVPNFDKGGVVDAPEGTPQVVIAHGGEEFKGAPPGSTTDTNSQTNLHPAIGNLLQAVNALLSNPDIQGLSKIPMQTGFQSYATGGIVPNDLGSPLGGSDIIPNPSRPPINSSGAASSQIPTPGIPTPQPAQQMPTPGIPANRTGAVANQPPPSPGIGSPIPIGNSASLGSSVIPGTFGPAPSGVGFPVGKGPQGIADFGPPNSLAGQETTHPPVPITPAPETVVSGPMAQNHVPYGPELTGLDQLGGLITPNGTPVPLSMWQLAHLDPTSLANYQNYIDAIAGWNSADLQAIGKFITGPADGINFTAPRKWNPIDITPAPSGG